MDWEEPRSRYFLERLGSFSRLIRFDKRGTGLSDRDCGLPDLETRMDDVRTVLDAVGSEQAALFGYSEGGPLCCLFAASHPERTSALVLYGTYAKRHDPDDDYPWAPTWEERERYADEIERGWAWEADLKRMAPSADSALTVWWGRRARAAASPGAARALILMNSEIDVRSVLHSVHVPTLVLHRDRDRDAVVDEGRYIAQHIPGAEFAELPGEDHIPWLNSDQILDPVEEFLTGMRAERRPDRILATILLPTSSDPRNKPPRSAITPGGCAFRSIGFSSAARWRTFRGAKSTQLAMASSRSLTGRRARFARAVVTPDVAGDPADRADVVVAADLADLLVPGGRRGSCGGSAAGEGAASSRALGSRQLLIPHVSAAASGCRTCSPIHEDGDGSPAGMILIDVGVWAMGSSGMAAAMAETAQRSASGGKLRPAVLRDITAAE
jgi:pimeloyl-ACP methyl ester carboxylesterase